MCKFNLHTVDIEPVHWRNGLKLSKSADFALRLVLYLGYRQQAATMPVISESLEISYNNLIKLVRKLAVAGVIATKQGKYGGIQLLKQTADITVKDIVEIVDGPVSLSDCLHKESSDCSWACTCEIKETFKEMQFRINQLMSEYTIEDMMSKNKGRGIESRVLTHGRQK